MLLLASKTLPLKSTTFATKNAYYVFDYFFRIMLK